MGIELPAELADVAAKTGVKWPEADEDKMRETAQAWRDAAKRVNTLISDADNTAQKALGTTEGAGANAARTHWGKYVQPDTGHLTSVARGCTNAADQLDHAANQVGEAKLAIVRNLVPLAQNMDVAQHAADAGHPTALLGLDTAVKGTAANVAGVHSTLVTAVQPTSGVVVDATKTLVDTTPGVHGPGPDLALLSGSGPGGQGVVNVGLPGDGGQGGVTVGLPGDGNQGGVTVGLPGDGGQGGVGVALPGDGGQGRPDLPLPVGNHPHDGPAVALPEPARPGVVEPGVPGYGDPATGPIPLPGNEFRDDLPTPPTGFPAQRPDYGVVAAGAAPAVLDAPPPQPTQAPPPVNQPPPAAAAPFAGPGGAAPPPPPPGAAPPAPAAPAAPVAPNQPQPQAHQPVQPGQSGQPPAQRGQAPAPVAVSAEPPRQAPVAQRQPQAQETTIALWLVRMFPIGHMPVAADRPARQLPPPRAEFDYAAGMRFEPHDHPQSDLIDDTQALHRTETIPAETEGQDPAALTSGHDPLGGQHERDFDRRFVVRAGSGRDMLDIEYAWPPGELFPEGATASGEPEVLEPGTIIDRFGTPEGRVFAAADTPFANRSLPPSHLRAGYRRYRVVRPLPVWSGISAAWFAQPGGGVRYRTVCPAVDLVALGYLEEESIDEG